MAQRITTYKMSCTEYKTDEDYVIALRSGGRIRDRATDCLYRRDSDHVVSALQRFVGYNSGQHDEVRDLAQDAFIIMVEKICDGGYNDGSLLHFWIGIAKGYLRNKVKRDSRMNLVDDPLQFDGKDSESPESLMISDQRREILESMLESIGGRCKKVLMMWARDYSMREITAELGFSSEAMVRKTKFKCKQKLVAMMKDVHIEF
jgi:RNA polymerase sigma factor (sigma-70 family)